MPQYRKKDWTGKAYLSLTVYLYLLVYGQRTADCITPPHIQELQSPCSVGWSEITVLVKLQVLTGRDGEMLKNMGSVKNLFINLNSKTQWILKVQKKSQRTT